MSKLDVTTEKLYARVKAGHQLTDSQWHSWLDMVENAGGWFDGAPRKASFFGARYSYLPHVGTEEMKRLLRVLDLVPEALHSHTMETLAHVLKECVDFLDQENMPSDTGVLCLATKMFSIEPMHLPGLVRTLFQTHRVNRIANLLNATEVDLNWDADTRSAMVEALYLTCTKKHDAICMSPFLQAGIDTEGRSQISFYNNWDRLERNLITKEEAWTHTANALVRKFHRHTQLLDELLQIPQAECATGREEYIKLVLRAVGLAQNMTSTPGQTPLPDLAGLCEAQH